MTDTTRSRTFSENFSTTVTDEVFDWQVISIPTTEQAEAIATGGTNAGLTFIVNHDDTNYVEAGFAAGVYEFKLYPGQVAMLPMAADDTIYLKANTAACKVEILTRAQ